jgi:hypothetical protein
MAQQEEGGDLTLPFYIYELHLYRAFKYKKFGGRVRAK